jgi:hypothetical protein
VAQHVAIGAFDAGLDQPGGEQHERDGTGQMDENDRAAHACIFLDEDGRAGSARTNAECRDGKVADVVEARVRIRFMGWLIA